MHQPPVPSARARLTLRRAIRLLTAAAGALVISAVQAQSLDDLRRQFQAPAKAKDWPAAEAVARQMVAQPRSDASDWRQLARVLAAQGKTVDAFEARQELVKRPGAESNDYNNLCWFLLERNHPLDARPSCQKAVDLDPTNHAALVNMGHSFLLTSDPTQATVWYRRTLDHLQKEEDLRDGPLYDLDLFIKNGWAVVDAQAARQWLLQTWPSVVAARQPRGSAKE